MSDLYCLKCRKYAYRNHKCDILSLIPVTRRCRKLADKLYSMGIEPLSVAHFTQNVVGSDDRHKIQILVELRYNYPTDILGDSLPYGWHFYSETISGDHTPLPLLILSYYETFHCEVKLTVKERIKQIIEQFENYLSTRDAASTRSVITLMYS